jgi:hypothetical protein
VIQPGRQRTGSGGSQSLHAEGTPTARIPQPAATPALLQPHRTGTEAIQVERQIGNECSQSATDGAVRFQNPVEARAHQRVESSQGIALQG